MTADREARVDVYRCGPLAIDRAAGKTLAVCVANCVISLSSTVFYYIELHRFKDYPFFTTQLNSLLVLMVAAVGLAATSRSRCGGSAGGADAALENRPLWRSCALLAVFLALMETMEIAGIQRIGNVALPPVLQQAVVPLSFVLSATFLHTAYTRLQIIGAVLVVVGVSAGFFASLISGKSDGSVNWIAAAWFVFSRVPQAIANVLGESVFRGRPGLTWIFRITLYTKLFVLFTNFGAAMLLSKALDSNVLHDYAAGTACLLGVEGPDGVLPETCIGAWKSVVIFAVPGAAYLLSEFQVLQYASATTYFLLAALQLPLQDALFALPWWGSALHASVHPTIVVQIIAVTAGLAMYGLGTRDAARRPSRAMAADAAPRRCELGGDDDDLAVSLQGQTRQSP